LLGYRRSTGKEWIMAMTLAEQAWRAPAERTLGFGVSLPTSGPFSQAEHILAVADLAEEVGLDDVWCNDHYVFERERLHKSPVGTLEACKGQDPNYFEGLVTLGVVGGRRRRIGVAMHGIVLPVREIRLFVKQITSLQLLVGGRLTISPGIGGAKNFPPMGANQVERGRRLDEALEVMTTMLASEHPLSFKGRFTSFEKATWYPRPQRSIRLWVTGDSEPALKRVVDYATGWFSTSARLHQFRELDARLVQLAEEADRDPSKIVRAADFFLCVADTTKEAIEISKASLEKRYGSVEAGLKTAAIGDAETVKQRLAEIIEMGFTYIEMRFLCHTPASHLEMIRRVATEVLPALRAQGPAKPAAALV
jgi:alkanesulfonate monooxygenase SsuD/methylene tetrahydromethanopterin reductase-like flavin-dependent oxidoreductase (luciferase family)